jgi:hypothetical protein
MCAGGRSGRDTTAHARKSHIPKRTKRGTGTFAMDIAQCPDGVNKPTGSFGADVIFYVRFRGVEVERGTFTTQQMAHFARAATLSESVALSATHLAE